MFDITKVLESYRNSVRVSEDSSGEAIFLTLPFYYSQSDESIAIKITETEDGRPVLSDCHTAFDYLEERDVEIEEYAEKLEKIKKRYGLIQDGNVFRLTVPTNDITYVKLYLGYFIQALSLIANLDI